jgi:hypothetical protein
MSQPDTFKNPLWIWLDPQPASLLDDQVSVNRKQNDGTETAVFTENRYNFEKNSFHI